MLCVQRDTLKKALLPLEDPRRQVRHAMRARACVCVYDCCINRAQAVISHLNIVFGNNDGSKEYWGACVTVRCRVTLSIARAQARISKRA
jgi:hypothetical protein